MVLQYNWPRFERRIHRIYVKTLFLDLLIDREVLGWFTLRAPRDLARPGSSVSMAARIFLTCFASRFGAWNIISAHFRALDMSSTSRSKRKWTKRRGPP